MSIPYIAHTTQLDDEWELFLVAEYLIDLFRFYLERIDFILENEV